MSISNFITRTTNTGSPSNPPRLFKQFQQYNGPQLFRYPIDLGASSKAHYMIIHINEQKRTAYQNSAGPAEDLPTILRNRELFGGTNTWNSTVVPGAEWASGLNPVKVFTQSLGLPSGSLQTIRRTLDTIALYMPDTLNFGQNQHYDDLRLAGVPSALIAGGTSLIDSFKAAGGVNKDNVLKILGKNVSPFVLNYFMQKRDDTRLLFGGYFGFVQNPQLEIIYSSPRMREFNFEFMFYPRSEVEAREVQKILDLLRFHQAPEVVQEFNGFFLTPPSEFDIKFYYNGLENDNIPKISTCVLHSMNIDYAPNGFAAYENPDSLFDPYKGGTGMPVAIRLSLGFREREIMTKAHYAADALKTKKPGVGGGGGDGTELGR